MNRAGNERTGRENIVIPIAAGEKITEGTMVAISAEGYALEASKTSGQITAGVCQEYADNTNGADGDLYVKVRRGAFVMNHDGTVKVTDLLKPCYVADQTTVTMTADGSSVAGTVLQVDDDGITIEIY